MITPARPDNENDRIKILQSYKLLDTLPEDSYDTITKLATLICNVPIALITLLDNDRNFLKSRRGIDVSQSPRDISFCGHAILTKEPIFIVEDSRIDERFIDNPLVDEFNAIFYAGVPLRTSSGHALGTLCVYDHKPRTLSIEEQEALQGLARQTVLLFESHKQRRILEQSQKEVLLRNDRLEEFAKLVAHDLKSPLASIEGLINLLTQEYTEENDEDFSLYLKHLDTSAKSMRDYIDGLLTYYRTDSLLLKKEDTTLIQIMHKIANMHKASNIAIMVENDMVLENIPSIAITQILSNLIDNASKYNLNDKPKVNVSCKVEKNHYTITVADNGIGIVNEQKDAIFDLFKTTGIPDRHGNIGSGMGLATVRKLVEGLGGNISVFSNPKEGSIFTFTIRR